jgi:hypothetical protein
MSIQEPPMPHWLTLFNSIVLLFFASTAAADVTLIHAGQLLAVPGKDPSTNMTIIVEDGRITGVRKVSSQLKTPLSSTCPTSLSCPGSWICMYICRAS